jgi:hypothetical protein
VDGGELVSRAGDVEGRTRTVAAPKLTAARWRAQTAAARGR